ncbi:MAG TPA: hypothetical protein VFW45_08395 [Candidatus Polarisedimenticolia bacterium]|nr:hypothetical protein [Candidatus Polarisedimenticolia bacterium]
MSRSLKPGSISLVALFTAVLFVFAFNTASGGPVTNDSHGSPEITAPASSRTADFQAPETLAFQALNGGACKAESAGEMFSAKPPGRPKTCRCSCGAPCQTDADCGGALGSCRVGVTCC